MCPEPASRYGNIIRLDYKDELMTIAVVQLQSPYHGELIGGIDHQGTQVLMWTNIEKRLTKIISTIELITATEPRTKLVVFPEYTVPPQVLPEIERLAREKGLIIIAGSHFVSDPTKTKHFRKNVCPIIIPDHGTEFIEKNDLSENEQGIVQPGDEHKKTLDLRWEASGKEMSLQVFVCMDYLTSLPQMNKDVPGIVIVPMCSERVMPFIGVAQTNIRFGKFVVLCNAVTAPHIAKGSTGLGGMSSIYGASKDLDENDAIVSLDSGSEGILLATLNAAYPAFVTPPPIPPKKPVVEPPRKYEVFWHDAKSSWDIRPMISPESETTPSRKIAVINPEVFRCLGKTLIFVFLGSREYRAVSDWLRKRRDINSFGVTGEEHDIIIQSVDDEIVSLRAGLNEIGGKMEYVDNWPYLKIDNFLKFWGFSPTKLASEDPLDESTIRDLALWSDNWGTEAVLDARKKELMAKHLILGKREINLKRTDGTTFAFLCVALPRADERTINTMDKHILKPLLADPTMGQRIVSLYGDNGKAMNIYYILELLARPHEIFSLIREVHKRCNEEQIAVKTKTFFVVETLSLGLINRIKVPTLAYQSKVIMRELSEKKVEIRLDEMTQERLEYVIDFYKERYPVIKQVDDPALRELLELSLLGAIKAMTAREFSVVLYKSPSDLITSQIECTLRADLEGKIEAKYDKDYVKAQQALGLANKQVWKFTYGEYIDALLRWNKTHPESVTFSDTILQQLASKTKEVRNKLAHGRTEGISREQLEEAISCGFDFLLGQANG